MRNFTFTFILLFSVVSVFAQKVTIYENNFDSYVDSAKLAQVAGAPWTTWSGTVGGGEDGTIYDTVSFSTPNALKIVKDNDLVYMFNDKTSGRYRVDFKIYVDSLKIGYFNMLQDFNGNNSKWAFDAFFLPEFPDGSPNGYFTINGKNIPFNYKQKKWTDISIFIDLDNDLGIILLDNEIKASWQWSVGAMGGNNLLKLDAIDFFGLTDQETKISASYYIDDLRIDSITAELPAITNLTAVKNSDETGIDLTWDAPAEAPSSYLLKRNDSPIQGTTETSYSDTNLYPSQYSYTVLAFHDSLGYSAPSAPTDSIKIGNYTERNYVLLEVATGVDCGYCPGAAMAISDLYDNNDAVAVIKYNIYNPNSPFYCAIGKNKFKNAYNLDGFPTAVFDGDVEKKFASGSTNQSLYPEYKGIYDKKIKEKALYNLSAEVEAKGHDNYTATVNVERLSAYLGDNVKLYLTLTESGVKHNWGNQTEVNERCIAMYPDESGEALDFSSSATLTKEIDFNFEIREGLTHENYELVVYLQSTDNLMVGQTTIAEIPVTIATQTIAESNITVYPNPASEFIKIKAAQGFDLQISDITGRVVKTQTINSDVENINIQDLKSGMYLINVTNGKENYTEKIIVK